MTADLIDERPDGLMDDMEAGATHWKCLLKCKGRQYTVYFSQGSAICKEPTTEDVLDCLASDAGSMINAQTFEDWASELGYDTDSRKAEKIYKACDRQKDNLERLLDGGLESLCFETERL